MTSDDAAAVSIKHRLLLSLLAAAGIVMVLFSTSRYGVGLSPDSVHYISLARNLIAGSGFVSFNGNPIVEWPPLYPTLLALAGGIFRTDPLLLASVVNAFIFGLIVYVGGWLTFKHFRPFPVIAITGALATLFSVPLFEVSVMAWSEPLFILFLLLSFIFLDTYLEKKDVASLLFFSMSVTLSCLTRYVGVTLILWGAVTIVIFNHSSLKERISHLSLFILISALPLGVWLIRNYAASSTLAGILPLSKRTLSQSLCFLFDSLKRWCVLSNRMANYPILSTLVMATAVFFLSFKGIWQNVKVVLRQSGALALFSITSGLFVIIYSAFLVFSVSVIAYEPINSRYLSPIYIPLNFFLLSVVQTLANLYQKRFSKKTVNYFLMIGAAIWLACQIGNIMPAIVNLAQSGTGYRSKKWVESKTMQYLQQHQALKSNETIYTNDPTALYLLANLISKWSPRKGYDNSRDAESDLLSLKGSWPKEGKARLVWFNGVGSLFTIDELRAIAKLDLIARFDDGAIYSVTKKETV